MYFRRGEPRLQNFRSSIPERRRSVRVDALGQVEVFRDRAGVTGLVMTKLDGTARGGILVAIAEKFALPVHAIGVGEGVDDLQPFEARDFARAIANS